MTVVYILEPFYGGSHKQLIDYICAAFSRKNIKVKLYTLPAKKWHWRARTSALNFAQMIEDDESQAEIVLFCSSVLNLPELLSLRNDLRQKLLKTIVYFHENQLVYPVQNQQQRDFQYGYNQILTALVANQVIFNSSFNLRSFLDNINSFFNLQPDFKPNTVEIRRKIEDKSTVLHFPVKLPENVVLKQEERSSEGKVLHIVWPHRWEHDKNPESFFRVLFDLKNSGFKFRLAVLGESFSQIPEVFNEAKDKLRDEIAHFGRLESKEDYFDVLQASDVAVSTANHEFFGVAMIEAALVGCYPLAPNRLAYPELFPDKNLYNTDQQLYKKLRDFCNKPHIPRKIWDKNCLKIESDLEQKYMELFQS